MYIYVKVDVIIVRLSTTVGTPIATTSTPNVSLLISFLVLPIPEPGDIPAVVIWIVLLRFSITLEARESTTITSLGLILSTIAFIASPVSIPVVPVTPRLIAEVFW